jgi:hypothetical protein
MDCQNVSFPLHDPLDCGCGFRKALTLTTADHSFNQFHLCFMQATHKGHDLITGQGHFDIAHDLAFAIGTWPFFIIIFKHGSSPVQFVSAGLQ